MWAVVWVAARRWLEVPLIPLTKVTRFTLMRPAIVEGSADASHLNLGFMIRPRAISSV